MTAFHRLAPPGRSGVLTAAAIACLGLVGSTAPASAQAQDERERLEDDRQQRQRDDQQMRDGWQDQLQHDQRMQGDQRTRDQRMQNDQRMRDPRMQNDQRMRDQRMRDDQRMRNDQRQRGDQRMQDGWQDRLEDDRQRERPRNDQRIRDDRDGQQLRHREEDWERERRERDREWQEQMRQEREMRRDEPIRDRRDDDRMRSERERRYETDRGYETDRRYETDRARRDQTVRGRIEGFRQIRLRGFEEPHVQVLLRGTDGREQVAHLGPMDEVEDMDLERGDLLVVRGREGRIDDRPVLIARRITHDDETYEVRWEREREDLDWHERIQRQFEREARERERGGNGDYRNDRGARDWDDGVRRGDRMRREDDRMRREDDRMRREIDGSWRDDGMRHSVGMRRDADMRRDGMRRDDEMRRDGGMRRDGEMRRDDGMGEEQTLRGEIEGLRVVRPEDAEELHAQALLRLEDGREEIVDLGPMRDLEQLDPQAGDVMEVRGRMERIDGEEVFKADEISVNGEVHEVERKDERRGARDDREARRHHFEGTIEGLTFTGGSGWAEREAWLRIRLDDWRVVEVHLGPGLGMHARDVARGDRVRVVGRQVRFSDRMILRAEQLRLERPRARTADLRSR